MPLIEDFAGYFEAIEEIWRFAIEGEDTNLPLGGPSPDLQAVKSQEASEALKTLEAGHPPVRRALLPPLPTQRETGLRVERVRLASPLEVVLSTIAGQYAPVAYGLAGILVIEKAMRLVMEWQKHRAEMEQIRTELQGYPQTKLDMPEPDAVGVLVRSRPSARPTLRHVRAVQRVARSKVVAVERSDAE